VDKVDGKDDEEEPPAEAKEIDQGRAPALVVSGANLPLG
jgi:hypothetical protein